MRHRPTGGSPATRTTSAAANSSTVPGPGERTDAERLEQRVGGRLERRQQRQLVGADRPDGGIGVHRSDGSVTARARRRLQRARSPVAAAGRGAPRPRARPDQVVVDVEAAGVNYVDALFVAGQYQIKPPVPFVPGTESAGRVSAVGESVDDLAGGPARPGVGRPGRVRHQGGGAGLGGDARCPTSSTRHGRRRSPRATAPACSRCASGRRRSRARPCSSWAPVAASGWPPSAWRGRSAAGCSAWPRARRSVPLHWRRAPRRRSTRRPSPVKDAARAWAGGTGVDVVIDPVGGALAEPSLRALGDRGRYWSSGSRPGHPLHPLEPGPVAQPDGHRHRLGHLGHAARRGAAHAAGTTCWPWWRRDDRPGPAERVSARRRGAGARGPAGPAHGGEDRPHPLRQTGGRVDGRRPRAYVFLVRGMS